MPTPSKPEDVRLNLRLPASVHQLLTEQAAHNLRSLNAEILYRLRESLKS